MDYKILQLSSTEINDRWDTGTIIKNHLGYDIPPVWSIYSVKRLSDGEIFSVGDTINMVRNKLDNHSNYLRSNWNGNDIVNLDIREIKIPSPREPLEGYVSAKGELFFGTGKSNNWVYFEDVEHAYSKAKRLHKHQREYDRAMAKLNEQVLNTLAEELKPPINKKLLLLL